MLGQVTKILKPHGRAEFAGRVAAWWDGRDYVAAPPAEPSEADVTHFDMSVKQREAIDIQDGKAPPKSQTKLQLRMRALQLAWGEQRFAPGSDLLDNKLLDMVFETANQAGALGFIGADPSLMSSCRDRTDRSLFAAEWRPGCLDVSKKSVSGVVISGADIDRPLCFPDRKIEGMLSVDAFAFADHKPGLAGRVFKALTGTGRWVAMDMVRNTPKTPAPAFASAWAEPQLVTAEEVDAVLKATGFVAVRREDVTSMLVKAARHGITGLGAALERAMKEGLDGPDGAVVLQEVAWEIQTWQARLRAMEGGALSAFMWIADKDPVLRVRANSAAAAAPERQPAPAGEAEQASLVEGAPVAAKPAPSFEGEAIIPPPVGGKVKKADGTSQAAIDALFD